MSAWVALPGFFWVGVAVAFGLCLGSFAGLLVHRLPRMIDGEPGIGLAHPASHCTSCGQRLRWWHNVPVFSYVVLRGRCGFCAAPIGRINLCIEVVFGALWGGFVAHMGPTVQALVWAGFFSALCVLTLIDWQSLLLPDVITLPLALAGVLAAWGGFTALTVIEAGLGCALGYGMLRLVAEVYQRLRGVSGMGGGDPKLMGALGAWLGPESLLGLLLTSSVLHVLLCLWQPRLQRWGWGAGHADFTDASRSDTLPTNAVPLGPALALAAVLMWATQAHAFNSTAVGYPFRVESVPNGETVQIVAHNEADAVVSVEVHLEGRNLASDRTWPVYAVVPARTHLPLANVYAAQSDKGFEVNFRFSRIFGDFQALVNTQPYRLPFQNGERYLISQAYGSTMTTHQDPKLHQAVDFDMPEGTPVTAAREGRVVDLQTGFTQGAADPRFIDKANWVKVQHADGTVATYAHLSAGAPLVQVGQWVSVGQVIGASGNTGYSSGPHLHFCVAKPVVTAVGMVEICLPVQFVTGQPAQVFRPQEGLVVMANDKSPAFVGFRDAGVWGRPTNQWLPNKDGAAQASDNPRVPWWLWVGALVLVLLWLRRALS
jgi:leader peptidase (prepilin peptidase)/N-methyltransferase